MSEFIKVYARIHILLIQGHILLLLFIYLFHDNKRVVNQHKYFLYSIAS